MLSGISIASDLGQVGFTEQRELHSTGYNLEPYDSHNADDTHAMQLRIAKLHELNRIRIARTFPVSLSTVRRAIDLLKTKREEGFSESQRRRERTVIKPDMAKKVEAPYLHRV